MNRYEDDPQEEPREGITEDEIIEEFLGENPRARELRLMRAALEQRKAAYEKEFAREKGERERTQMSHKIKETERQIDALHREEAITSFVEASVRVTLHKPAEDEFD